jgi:hypothetical protein
MCRETNDTMVLQAIQLMFRASESMVQQFGCSSISILQNEFHKVSATTTLALYNTHSKPFNKLLWSLHDDVMQEAIRDVMNCIGDDDSGEETESMSDI